VLFSMYTNFHKTINMTNNLGQQFWFIRSSCLWDMCIVLFSVIVTVGLWHYLLSEFQEILGSVYISAKTKFCILESAALENVCPPFYLLLQWVSTMSECEKRTDNHANIPLFTQLGPVTFSNSVDCFSELCRLPEQIQLVFGMGAMLSQGCS